MLVKHVFTICNLQPQIPEFTLFTYSSYLPIYLPCFLLIESVKKYFWLGNQQENSWWMNLKLGKFCGELLLNTLFKVSASKTFWFLECWRQIVWQQSKYCKGVSLIFPRAFLKVFSSGTELAVVGSPAWPPKWRRALSFSLHNEAKVFFKFYFDSFSKPFRQIIPTFL